MFKPFCKSVKYRVNVACGVVNLFRLKVRRVSNFAIWRRFGGGGELS